MTCPYLNPVENGTDKPGLHYQNYLKVDTLLSLQELESEKLGNKVHDEHLFIIVHQVFELWFKQVLEELNSVKTLLKVEDKLSLCVARMQRVKLIMQHQLMQFTILETTPPLHFKEYRDCLYPASGFQSQKFRIIENTWGLKMDYRIKCDGQDYKDAAFEQRSDLKDDIVVSENEISLFDVVQRWLEDAYKKENAGEDFTAAFQLTVKEFIERKPEEERAALTARYSSIFDEQCHKDCIIRGDRRLSLKAMRAVLMINFLQDEPKYSTHFQLINLLADIDYILMEWRFKHRTTVLKMLGTNQKGTGGSVGYPYLTSTMTDRYYVYLDITNAAEFLMPRWNLRGIELCTSTL